MVVVVVVVVCCQQSAFLATNDPSKVHNCTDHLHSEISSRALAKFHNIEKIKKLFESHVYFVRILIRFYTYSNN